MTRSSTAIAPSPLYPTSPIPLLSAACARVCATASRLALQPPAPIPQLAVGPSGARVVGPLQSALGTADVYVRESVPEVQIYDTWVIRHTPTETLEVLTALEALASELEAEAVAHEAAVALAIAEAVASEEPAIAELGRRLAAEAAAPALTRAEDLAALDEEQAERYEAGLLPAAELTDALRAHYLPALDGAHLTMLSVAALSDYGDDLRCSSGADEHVGIVRQDTSDAEEISAAEWARLKALRACLPSGAVATPVEDRLECTRCDGFALARRVRIVLTLPSGRTLVRRYDL